MAVAPGVLVHAGAGHERRRRIRRGAALEEPVRRVAELVHEHRPHAACAVLLILVVLGRASPAGPSELLYRYVIAHQLTFGRGCEGTEGGREEVFCSAVHLDLELPCPLRYTLFHDLRYVSQTASQRTRQGVRIEGH